MFKLSNAFEATITHTRCEARNSSIVGNLFAAIGRSIVAQIALTLPFHF